MSELKLAALDGEDLSVLSTHSQDAVVKVGDMHWQKSDGRFVVQLHRFAWAEAEKQKRGFFAPKPTYERRLSILHFARVQSVRARNIRMDAGDAVLNLLALTYEPEGEGPNGIIRMIFAGDAEIALTIECIEAQLADTGAAWATENLPEHEAAEGLTPEALADQ